MDTIQVVIMQEAEARLLVNEIKAGITAVGDKLLELYDREGWKTLGYGSWRECCIAEFEFSQSRVYQLLAHAQVVKNISDSTKVEKSADSTLVEKLPLPTSERQTRPLTQLPPAQQVPAWQQSVKESNGGQPSAKTVERVVREIRPITKESQTQHRPKAAVGLGGFSQVNHFDEFSQEVEVAVSSPLDKMKTALEDKGYFVASPSELEGDSCPCCGKLYKR